MIFGDDQKPLNRKVRPLSDAAYRLDDHAVAYCSRHETDGLIWQADLEEIILGIKGRRIAEYIAELVRPVLWHVAGATCDSPLCPAHYAPIPDGAWAKHDYFAFQQSKKEREEAREKKALAGAKGGVNSGRARRLKSLRESTGTPSTHASNEATTTEAPASPVVRQAPGVLPNPYPYPLDPNPIYVVPIPKPLSRSPEAVAIAIAWEDRIGRPLSQADLEWVEGQVGELRVLRAEEFVEAMVAQDAYKVEAGRDRTKSVRGYRQTWRHRNALLRDQGRRDRDTASAAWLPQVASL